MKQQPNRIDDGGPAFPVITTNDTVTTGPWGSAPGMTLRDWFAGQALAGLSQNDELSWSQTADRAYAAADAMLAARKGGAE